MPTQLMNPAAAQPASESHQARVRVRSRKAHRKSRYGCSNCKLRRVKCDESKPCCLKCVSFGIGCSYEPGTSEMQLVYAGAFKVDFSPSSATPTPRSPPGFPVFLPLAGAGGEEGYQMNAYDLSLISKFRNNVILTVGSELSSLHFQNKTLELAMANPYLVHIVLTLTLIYDTHVTGTTDRKKDAALAFHFAHGAALFSAKLSQSVIAPEEQDALWSAAALIGSSAFADVKATKIEESWPLIPPSAQDLDWLKMTGGKRAVYKVANPGRRDSIFKSSSLHKYPFVVPTQRVGEEILNLPPRFVELYSLDELSTPTSNPYHSAATVLAQIMPLKCHRETVAKFLSFSGFPDTRYMDLLLQREPRALLLLVYWYSKALSYQQWWIWRRAMLEGPAIIALLEKSFAGDAELLELLEAPKAAFATASTKS